MPTAGKAAGALLFAVLAFVVARMIGPGLPAAVPSGGASLVASAFGALTGWRIAGGRSRGATQAAAKGVTAALAAAFWTLLFGAAWQMLRRSLRGLYDDPVEAVGAVAVLMLEYGLSLLDPAALAVLIFGGALCGIAAGAAARRLP